jgi:hypothetical protein
VSRCEHPLPATQYLLLTPLFFSASPQIYFDAEDNYRKGHAIAAGYVAGFCIIYGELIIVNSMLFLCIMATFTLRTRLALKNKKNAKLVAELQREGKLASARKDEEIADTDPRWQFMT